MTPARDNLHPGTRGSGPAGAGRSRQTGPSVYLHGSPCPKATVDIEVLSGFLKSHGFKVSRDPERAEVIITWGCGFVDDAKRESIDDVLRAADAGRRGAARAVLMAGCLPEKYGDELAESLPEVDAFVGASALGLMPGIIENLLGGGDVRRVWLCRPFTYMETSGGRDLGGKSPWTRALLLGHGCDNRCTYCAIPQMQGALRSRQADEILDEARLLVGRGAAEIVLAGQDIASYGRDLGGPGLGSLLERLAAESGARWIRLCYAHPDNLDPGVADVMARHANVCRYIDLPIQHAAPSVLRAMGRRPEPEAIREKIERMRERVPDLAVRTSVIVGFPGESEADFEFLLGFLRRAGFDLVGVFEFSPQPGTPAAALPRAVPGFIRQQRLIEVVGLAEEMGAARAASMAGRRLDVLVEEGAGAGDVLGRSQYDAPDVDRRVRVTGSDARPGQFVNVRVTGHDASGDLEARATGAGGGDGE